MRLTRTLPTMWNPTFRPTGRKSSFRSTRDGGGLYVIPALGGDGTQIADGGRQPQFSPDGSKIAYWTGPAEPLPLRNGSAHAFVLDLATSAVRRLRPDFAASAHPVWNPDGTHIGFLGLKDARNTATYNWWITPAMEGPAPAVK